MHPEDKACHAAFNSCFASQFCEVAHAKRRLAACLKEAAVRRQRAERIAELRDEMRKLERDGSAEAARHEAQRRQRAVHARCLAEYRACADSPFCSTVHAAKKLKSCVSGGAAALLPPAVGGAEKTRRHADHALAARSSAAFAELHGRVEELRAKVAAQAATIAKLRRHAAPPSSSSSSSSSSAVLPKALRGVTAIGKEFATRMGIQNEVHHFAQKALEALWVERERNERQIKELQAQLVARSKQERLMRDEHKAEKAKYHRKMGELERMEEAVEEGSKHGKKAAVPTKPATQTVPHDLAMKFEKIAAQVERQERDINTVSARLNSLPRAAKPRAKKRMPPVAPVTSKQGWPAKAVQPVQAGQTVRVMPGYST